MTELAEYTATPLTKFENELGSALEALVDTLQESDPHANALTIFNGYQCREAFKLVGFYREKRRLAGFHKHPWWQFWHLWSTNAKRLVKECIVCGKLRACSRAEL